MSRRSEVSPIEVKGQKRAKGWGGRRRVPVIGINSSGDLVIQGLKRISPKRKAQR